MKFKHNSENIADDEPELKPEFIARAKRIMKEKKIHVGTVENLRKMLNM